MKLKKKFLVGILAVLMTCIILQPNKSNAALQSNGGTPATKNINNWILQIRKMQEIGGTLGRTDTIDTTTLTSGATDLDIHMEKNTEYGAMAILSASAYGNPNPIVDGGTTTGNSTGIVINLNKEWVAAGTLTYINVFTSANSRYKDSYTSSYVAKMGDATKETAGWHSSGASTWIRNDTWSGLLRAYSGSIFSYFGDGGDNPINGPNYATYDRTWASRAAIVVGTGI